MTVKNSLADNLTELFPAPASYALNRGDLLYWDSSSHYVKGADARTDLTTLALNQADFAPLFAGVMQDQRLSTQTDSTSLVSVVTDGVFDCDCVSQTWEIGDLVGVARDSSGSKNFPQKLDKALTPNLAIGTIVRREASATTTCRVRLIARIGRDGVHQLTRAVGGQQGQGIKAATDANTTLVVSDGPIVTMTPTATRTLTFPAAAQSKGLMFYVVNNGSGQNITLTGDASNMKGTATLGGGKNAIVWCDGTNWNSIVSA